MTALAGWCIVAIALSALGGFWAVVVWLGFTLMMMNQQR